MKRFMAMIQSLNVWYHLWNFSSKLATDALKAAPKYKTGMLHSFYKFGGFYNGKIVLMKYAGIHLIYKNIKCSVVSSEWTIIEILNCLFSSYLRYCWNNKKTFQR